MANNPLYSTALWRKLRADHKRSHPFCEFCLRRGLRVQMKHVDHKIRHGNDPKKFYDPANLQSLCERCHNSAKQRMERGGRLLGADSDGMPTDPNHPWNTED